MSKVIFQIAIGIWLAVLGAFIVHVLRTYNFSGNFYWKKKKKL